MSYQQADEGPGDGLRPSRGHGRDPQGGLDTMNGTPARQYGATVLHNPSAHLAERITIGFLAQFQARTREAYTIDLTLWARYLAEHDVDPLQVERTHLELWMRAEEARGLAPATIARRLGTVRGWYRYAVEEGHLTTDPGARVKPPKIRERVDLPYLDRWDMAELVRVATGHDRPDARCLVIILGYNGLRISEALNLDVTSYTRSGGFDAITFVRKGGKPAVVPLVADACRAIEACVDGRKDGPLLRNTCGRRMTRRNAHDLIDQLVAATGITKHVTPHTFRRSFVSIGLDAGVSLTDMAMSAGHEQMSTTLRYDRRRNEMARNGTHVVAQQIASAMRT
jgi:integrase/recombinase XerD